MATDCRLSDLPWPPVISTDVITHRTELNSIAKKGKAQMTRLDRPADILLEILVNCPSDQVEPSDAPQAAPTGTPEGPVLGRATGKDGARSGKSGG